MNLKTAKALGLTIPPSLLQRGPGDRVSRPRVVWSRIGTLLPCVSLGLAALLLLGACASLVPERTPLSLRVEGLRRMDLPGGEGTQWDYTVVVKNPNRRPATLFQESVTLGWDGVYRTEPLDQTRREVPARGDLLLPKSTVFRRSEFEAPNPSAPGRPPSAPARKKGMWILWQFLGRHDGGGAIALDLDFFPDPAR